MVLVITTELCYCRKRAVLDNVKQIGAMNNKTFYKTGKGPDVAQAL
jgi:hypothetical protein